MDSVLRPRDIQARIRAGESPETVASAAQTTVEKVMVFATPVLAERAWVAEQAQKASVRRRAGDGVIGHLAEAVERRLADRGLAPEDVRWDAWRREDGRWSVVVEYGGGAGTTRAGFAYDAAGRYVVAEDDEARWLVGERAGAGSGTVGDTAEVASGPAAPPHPPEGALEQPAPPAPRAGEQLRLGDDALAVVTGRPPAAPDEPTQDLGEVRARLAEPETLFDAPPAGPPPSAAPGTVAPDTVAGDTVAGDTVAGHSQAVEEEPDDESPRPRPAKDAKPRKQRGRASVPSWDEIMFGSGKGE